MLIHSPAILKTKSDVAVVSVYILRINLAISLTKLSSLTHNEDFALRGQRDLEGDRWVLLGTLLDRSCFKNCFNFTKVNWGWNEAFRTIKPCIIPEINDGALVQPDLLLQVQLRAGMEYLAAVF